MENPREISLSILTEGICFPPAMFDQKENKKRVLPKEIQTRVLSLAIEIWLRMSFKET